MTKRIAQPSTPTWRITSSKLTRRSALLGLSATVAGSLASRPARAQAGSCVLTPDSGEGPFYFDPSLLRSDVGSDRPGLALALEIQILRLADCAVLTDARVDIWQADAVGLYSGYADQPGVGGISTAPAVGQDYLRGTQFTDASGNVRFRTIYPSWYGGRTPHIHFKIFLGGNEVIASQIFFADEINNEVFTSFDPYREHAAKRTGFNSNDMFMQDGVGGVFAEVDRSRDSYSATAVIVVAEA